MPNNYTNWIKIIPTEKEELDFYKYEYKDLFN